jgi:hypothetical protein
MSAPDLHPEELLDKAAAGTLSDSERAFFDAHVAQCSVCRFELAARKDFQSFESPGLNVDNLVARALSGMPAAEAPRAPRRAPLMRFAAVAVVLFVSMASFAAVTGVLPKIIAAFTSPPAPPEPAAPVHPERSAQREVEGSAAKPPEPAPEVEAPTPIPEEQPAAPATVHPERSAKRDVEGPAVKTPPPPMAAEVPDAGGLFAQANRARIGGDRPEAVKLYGALMQQFPQSAESHLAQATVGRLLLDSGDPQGALTQLDGYLASGDATLKEEVLAARATALSRLNRPRDEAAAWHALLESYPDSVHAVRAQQRLSELEAR